jgi:hypothetical protein
MSHSSSFQDSKRQSETIRANRCQPAPNFPSSLSHYSTAWGRLGRARVERHAEWIVEGTSLVLPRRPLSDRSGSMGADRVTDLRSMRAAWWDATA